MIFKKKDKENNVKQEEQPKEFTVQEERPALITEAIMLRKALNLRDQQIFKQGQELRMLRNQVKNLQQNEPLKLANETLTLENEKLQEEKEELEKQVEMLKHEISDLNDQLDKTSVQLSSKTNQLHKEIADMEAEKTELNNKYQSALRHLKAMVFENESLKLKYEAVTAMHKEQLLQSIKTITQQKEDTTKNYYE